MLKNHVVHTYDLFMNKASFHLPKSANVIHFDSIVQGEKEEIGKLCEYFTIHKILSNAIKRQEREGKFHLVEGKSCYRKTITGIARFYLGNF